MYLGPRYEFDQEAILTPFDSEWMNLLSPM